MPCPFCITRASVSDKSKLRKNLIEVFIDIVPFYFTLVYVFVYINLLASGFVSCILTFKTQHRHYFKHLDENLRLDTDPLLQPKVYQVNHRAPTNASKPRTETSSLMSPQPLRPVSRSSLPRRANDRNLEISPPPDSHPTQRKEKNTKKTKKGYARRSRAYSTSKLAQNIEL